VARSNDGVSNWHIDSKPSFAPDPARFSEEEWGVEDPRLTWVEERQEWIIAYTAFSPSGPLVSLAQTKDFRAFTRLGPVMPPEDKDAAVFSRRFEGRYAMIHRPVSAGSSGAHIWLSFSHRPGQEPNTSRRQGNREGAARSDVEKDNGPSCHTAEESADTSPNSRYLHGLCPIGGPDTQPDNSPRVEHRSHPEERPQGNRSGAMPIAPSSSSRQTPASRRRRSSPRAGRQVPEVPGFRVAGNDPS
jgi:hypothetical protein